MHKFVVLWSCVLGLTAAGVLNTPRIPVGMERNRLDISSSGTIGVQSILRLSSEDLMREKFILDLLMEIDQPLRQPELLQLSDSIVMDPSKYIGEIDTEMQHVMELWSSQKLVGKSETCSILCEDHVRQLVGLYRLLVRSINWDTLLRNAIALREQVNSVLFVNSLVLAIRDRPDTQNLIVPGLNEILPRLLYDDDIIKRVESIDLSKSTETVRPQLMDMIGVNRRQRISEQKAGILNILGREQLWKPWQLMHMDLARQRMEMTRPSAQRIVQDKIIVPVAESLQNQGMDMFIQDIGMKEFGMGFALRLELGSIQDVDQQRQWEDEQLQLRVGGSGANIDDGRKVMQEEDEMSVPTARLLRVGRRRQNQTPIVNQNRASVGQMQDWDIENLPMSHIGNERLVRVGRRRSGETINPTQRQLLLNAMMNRAVRDGRLVMDEDDEDVSMEQQIEDIRRRLGGQDQDMRSNHRVQPAGIRSSQRWNIRGLPQSNVGSDRLLHQRSSQTMQSRIRDGRMVMDDEDMEDEQQMGVDIKNQIWAQNRQGDLRQDRLIGQQLRLVQQQLLRESQIGVRRGIQDWDIENLPLAAINDERLLHVGRRRGGETIIPTQRQLLLNAMMNRAVRDGRLVIDEDDEDVSMEQQIEDIRRRLGGQDQDLNTVNLRTTHVGNDRLLRVNRRRNIRDGRLVQDDEDIQDSSRLSGRQIPQQGQQEISLRLERMRQALHHRLDIVEGIRRQLENRSEMGDQEVGDQIVRIKQMQQKLQQRLAIADGIQKGLINRQNIDIDRMQEQWDIEDLPTADVDSERLLKISRRRMDRMEDEQEARMLRQNPRQHKTQRNSINTEDMDEQETIRIPRSVGQLPLTEQHTGGEIMVHILQQIMARINMERISLGLPKLSEGVMVESVISGHLNNPRLLQNQDQSYAMRLNEKRVGVMRQRLVLDKLNVLSNMLQKLTEDQMETTKDMDAVVGIIVQKNILGLMQAVLTQIHDIRNPRDVPAVAELGYFMQEPIAQATLECIVKLIQLKRHELKPYTSQQLKLNGVTINDVQVDRLRTFVEQVDADMVNVVERSADVIEDQNTVLLREKRLNHQPFNIKLDLSSNTQKRVVVRVLLSPKLDGSGKPLSTEEQQLNTMVLDATVADLIPGRNQLQLRSSDIAWTTRDTTPLTDIYRRVVLAIKGNLKASEDRVVSQRCGFPHRLLLPRGRAQGLPMQLMVVVSPVTEQDKIIQQGSIDNIACSMGTSTVNLDQLPLLYPLDRQIGNLQILQVPNINIQDILIYHDE